MQAVDDVVPQGLGGTSAIAKAQLLEHHVVFRRDPGLVRYAPPQEDSRELRRCVQALVHVVQQGITCKANELRVKAPVEVGVAADALVIGAKKGAADLSIDGLGFVKRGLVRGSVT